MCPAYFVTEFDVRDSAADWPREFVIISAFATTGETWTDEQNQACDQELEKALQERNVWMRRVTGRSPTGDHAEPSWAAELPFDEACDLGLKFKQTAIYHVCDDQLSVSYCDQQRKFVPVSGFRERIHFQRLV